MNKLIAFALTLMIGTSVFGQDPVIMTINDKKITKSEFLQIYLKNNDNPKYDQASLDEYVELFKKFKLKVAEAELLGYDTIPKLVRELEGYEKQLARPYMIDSSKNESLIREAYDRTTNEVRASHILIRCEANASPADTLIAYNKIAALKKRIEKGEPFDRVAKGPGGSEDPSAKSNAGDLGYFNAFQMVYPFEDAAYSTPVGSISEPFRTRFGYHIVSVVDKRPARGTIETAHLMISIDQNATPEMENDAKKKIDELYDLIVAGESFEELVAEHSDDPSSSKKGGVLPAFGTGSNTRMVPEFTEAAFALKNDGDVSKPIKTDYGYHIIKRLKLTPVPAFETMKKELEGKVAKDVRSEQSQASFIGKLKKEYSYKDKSKSGLKWFYKNLDSTYAAGNFDFDQLKSNKVLFKLDGKKFRQQDFVPYLKKSSRTAGDNVEGAIVTMHKDWEKESILAYEQSRLSTKYPAYKALTTEYHDGILLYEVMSDKVWNKAMKDTVGLKAFHAQNAANYVWGKRLDADMFECASMDIAKKTKELLANDTLTATTVTRMVNESSALNVKHKRSKFDIEKTEALNNAPKALKVGPNEIYEFGGKYYFVNVVEILEPGQKEFSEAKGAITSDYQNYLEAEWLKELEQKHKVTINKDVLYNLGK